MTTVLCSTQCDNNGAVFDAVRQQQRAVFDAVDNTGAVCTKTTCGARRGTTRYDDNGAVMTSVHCEGATWKELN